MWRPSDRRCSWSHRASSVSDADVVVGGQLYPVYEGDVLIFAPNEEHGAYVGPNGAKVLNVFSPHREDLLEKLHKKASFID